MDSGSWCMIQFFAADMTEFRTKLLNELKLLEDTIVGELYVCYHKFKSVVTKWFLPIQYVAEFLDNFSDYYELLFDWWIFHLCIQQILAPICYWTSLLTNDATHLIFTSVHIDHKSLRIIRVKKESTLLYESAWHFKNFLCFLRPFYGPFLSANLSDKWYKFVFSFLLITVKLFLINSRHCFTVVWMGIFTIFGTFFWLGI